METALLLFNSILVMFLMLLAGYGLAKSGTMKKEDSHGLSLLLLYVIFPCVIINSSQIEYSDSRLLGLGIAALAAIIVHVIYIGIGKLLGKWCGFSPMERASVIYTNSVNLIIPIVVSILGPEYTLYTCAYGSVMAILIWTHCYALMSGASLKQNLLKAFCNVNVIAIVIAVVLFVLQIGIWTPVKEAMNGIGLSIGPVSMILMGMVIGFGQFGSQLKNPRVYCISALRLLVAPLCCLPVYMLMAWVLRENLPNIKGILYVSYLAATAPCAVFVMQFSLLFKKDSGYAGTINVVSTLLCILTMPLMAWLFDALIA